MIICTSDDKETGWVEQIKKQLKPPFCAIPGEGDIVANKHISITIEGEWIGRVDEWVAEALNEKWERDFGSPSSGADN